MLSLVLEANPLLLINQGFGLSAEAFLTPHFSVGVVGEYYTQEPYNSQGVQATREIFSVGPQVRWYLSTGSGPFVGAEVLFSRSLSSIADATETRGNALDYLSPISEVGYQFVLSSAFSFSLYVGLGVNTRSTTLPDNMIPADRNDNAQWQDALSALNDHPAKTFLAYGLTLGISL